MMAVIRRIGMFLLLAALAAGLCSCAQKKEADTGAEVVQLTALQYELESQAIDFSDMWYFDELEKQTGVHVEFEEVKDANWVTRHSLMFASNNFRDMVLRGSLDTEEYGVSQHLVLPLDEYLEAHMPHYYARLQQTDADDAIPSSDGKSYYVGFLLSQNINTDGHFFINRQWLDALNLSVPTTVEELTAVLRAFRDGDPNGNGLKDEIPYQATMDDCNTGIYNAFTAWGIPMNVDYVYIDDKHQVRFAPEAEGFRACMEWLHLLCEEKLLDVECITQGSNLWGSKVNDGTAGYFSYWRLGNTVLSSDIAAQYECMLPVSAEGYQAKTGRVEDVVEFGAALTVQNRDIEASLRWLDAQMETENMLVAQNGPVGDMLILREDGRYEVAYVPAENELYGIVPVICGQFFAPAEYYESVYVPAAHRQEKTAYCEIYEEAGVVEEHSFRTLTYVMPKTSEEAARLLQLKNQLKTIIDAALVECITSGVTDESYAAFVKRLEEAGAAEYKALYQTAYDRYRTRTEADAQ